MSQAIGGWVQPSCAVGFGVWSAERPEDYAAWLELWNRWPQREIQAHPGYALLYADGQSRFARAAYFESPQGCVLYPFVSRDLSGEHFWTPQVGPARDIISPYSYGGAFMWGASDTPALAAAFWPCFDAWARESLIVSEFIRFSLFPDCLLDYPGERVPNKQNVVWDLEPDEEALWRGVASKVRRNVSRARQRGVEVEFDTSGQRLDEFLEIYTATMDRREALRGYYFPPSFYQSLQTRLPGHFAYALARHQGRAVSVQLVLLSADKAYFFLGGTDVRFFEHRPNDLLMYEIALWLKRLGKRWYVLGGGPTPFDGVFRFKQSFAPSGLVPFYLGRRVLDPPRYELLVRQRQETAADAAASADFFPAYRAGANPARSAADFHV